MAKYLTNIDLAQNQLVRAAIHNASSDPSGVSGQVYFNTTSNVLKYYNGTTWNILSATGSSVASVTGTAPITANGASGSAQTGAVTVAITAASGSAAGSMSSADYTYLHAATNSNTASTLVQRDGSGNFSTNMITLAGTTTNATDAATKSYVDSVATGLDVKPAVRVATTAVLPGTPTYSNGTSGVGATLTAGASYFTALAIDGVTLVTGDRVLVNNQSAALQNGIYSLTTQGNGTSTNYVLTRTKDSDGNSSNGQVIEGDFVFVAEGTANASSGWVLTSTNNANAVIGTTALSFTQFSGAGEVVAGNGLQKSGNTISALIDPASTQGTNVLTASSSGIKITTTNITGVGTLTAGTWTATTIGTGYGGTGLTGFAGAGAMIYATSTSALTSLTGNATATKQFLSMTSSTPAWGVLANTDIPTFTGATSGAAGTTGGVAAPTAGQQGYVLTGANTWVSLSSAGGITSVSIGSTNGANNLLAASTSSGATTIDFVTTVGQNKIFGGPTGAAGAPVFRNLVTGDFGSNAVAVANGGTGLTAATANGVLYGASSSTTAFTAAGSQYNVLVAGSGGTPAFGSINLASSAAVGSSILPLANGGTNSSTASGARSQLASDITGGTIPVKTSFNVGDGSSTAITVTHNLGTRDLIWDLVNSATPWDVQYADITFPTTNTATVTFGSAPALNAYRFVLIG